MHLSFLRDLWAHMEWADALVWRSVLAHEAARADDYVLGGLTHLHLVQRAYLAVWHGRPVEMAGPEDFDGPGAIRDWARGYYPEAAAFLGGLGEASLVDAIPIPWNDFIEKAIGGPPEPATLGEMLFQVTSHSTHHRAQVNRRIREVGGEPGFVDYIGWVWRGRPAPAWG